MARPRKQKEVKEANYTASLTVLGQTYTAKGNTALEAISNINPVNVKGKGILTVSNGDVSREKVVNAFQLFRMYSASRLMKEVSLKNFSILFDF